jgi:hypothetical protein
MQDVIDRVTANPKFLQFVAMRNRYSIIMTIVSAAAYYGFILLVAFDKELLAKKIGAGVTSLRRTAWGGRHRLHHHPDLDLRASRQQRIRRYQRGPHQGGNEVT